MYYSQKATHLTGFVFTVFLSYVIAFPAVGEDKTYKLKVGFDLTQGVSGGPLLKVRNYEEPSKWRKLNGHKENFKRSVGVDSSSGSEEIDDKKETDETKAVRDSDLSEDFDSSGSEGDRHISTKGLIPEDFEPENSPKIRDKYNDKNSDEDSE